MQTFKDLIILSNDLNYLDEAASDKVNSMCEEIGKMLYGLQNKLNP